MAKDTKKAIKNGDTVVSERRELHTYNLIFEGHRVERGLTGLIKDRLSHLTRGSNPSITNLRVISDDTKGVRGVRITGYVTYEWLQKYVNDRWPDFRPRVVEINLEESKKGESDDISVLQQRNNELSMENSRLMSRVNSSLFPSKLST